MGSLISQFGAFVEQNSLFKKTDKLLLAVSGGLDSVALTVLLRKSGYSFSIAHCNFQLRGQDSIKDELLVQSMADSTATTFHCKKFNTVKYANEKQLSIQLAARQLRYDWFEELMNEEDYKFLLTAHHANDQVETVLYNMTKGTGIAGLRGIPFKTDKIVRPLLSFTRTEIENFANDNKLEWREDVSNKDDKYSRNKIRLNVIPELEKINPNITGTFLNNAVRFASLEKLLTHQVELIKKDYLAKVKNDISLGLGWYDENSGGLALLIEILKPYGFNFDQSQRISHSLKSNRKTRSGKQYFSNKYQLIIDRGKLEISTKEKKPEFEMQIDKQLVQISTRGGKFFLEKIKLQNKWSTDKKTAFLDYDKLTFPLKVRNRKLGDAFIPLGMKFKKKLSDFMIDEKIPLNLKNNIVLFESNDDIVWVAGYRIDDRFKISTDTQQVLIITMTEND